MRKFLPKTLCRPRWGGLAKTFLAFACLGGLTVGAPEVLADGIRIVATTSVLGAAARAVGGDKVEVETLLPAGTCPSHFDITPSQAASLLKGSLVVRHEFQDFLDERLRANGVPSDRILPVATKGGLCEPGTFAELCSIVAGRLGRSFPENARYFEERSENVNAEAAAFGAAMRQKAASLAGKPVAVARHQAAFAVWLGLDVRVVLPPGDDPSPSLVAGLVDKIRASGAELVVGNVPSGTRLPAVVADAASLPSAMLENFPASTEPKDYWALVNDNVDALLRASKR